MNLEFAHEVADNAELAADFGQEALQYVLEKLNKLEGFIKENGYGASACATFLACDSFDKNSDKSEYILEGVTEGTVEKGDWKITVERIKGELK